MLCKNGMAVNLYNMAARKAVSMPLANVSEASHQYLKIMKIGKMPFPHFNH